MIRISAIADYLSPDFTIIGIARLFHNQGSKIILDDGTTIDVFDNGTLVTPELPSHALVESISELPYLTEGIIKIVTYREPKRVQEALQRAS